jgi:hypothetical protein
MRLLLILNLFLCQSLLGQSCPNDSLFNRFKYDVQIHPNRIVWDDETKESYYKLMIDCPINCLVKYTDDSVPSIRAIIFEGLVEKNADDDILGEILDKHKNDTAQFIHGPTDLVMTWTVSRYMQIKLKSKSYNKTFNTADNFESRLENLRSRLKKTNRIYIPGEYHGMVTKDDLLLTDSLTCTLQGYRVISFSLISDTKTFSTNNVFTQEIKDFIRTMTSGDRIYIDDIRVEFPDKTIGLIGLKILSIQ